MRRRSVWLALGVLLLVAGGGAVLVPLARGAASGEPAPSSSTQLLACAEIAPGDGYCERLADDLAERGPLTRIDRATGERFAGDLRAVFEGELGARCGAEGRFCVFAEPPTAEALGAALVAAGFAGPVRPARYTDPAPAGAIVYGVRAGAACLVGWVDRGSAQLPRAVGRREDGSCLPA
jgi:hypothetical protein